ncbi:MAG TPA: hypothetical protein VEY51_09080 [Chondromyces sp.]|nr:hypothetical protein [Chondromyces sp.]
MIKDLNDPSFLNYCENKTPLEIVTDITDGNVRGLDKLALESLYNRKKLPSLVVNVLVVYFFNAYRNTVYDRKDLARIYDYWAQHKVQTFFDAMRMAQMDIKQILKS